MEMTATATTMRNSVYAYSTWIRFETKTKEVRLRISFALFPFFISLYRSFSMLTVYCRIYSSTNLNYYYYRRVLFAVLFFYHDGRPNVPRTNSNTKKKKNEKELQNYARFSYKEKSIFDKIAVKSGMFSSNFVVGCCCSGRCSYFGA